MHKDRTDQLIYDVMDEKFTSFVENNRSLFEEMEYEGVLNANTAFREGKLCSIDMLEEPFNVAYIGLTSWGEGNLIAFMDKSFNKLYHYYDVD